MFKKLLKEFPPAEITRDIVNGEMKRSVDLIEKKNNIIDNIELFLVSCQETDLLGVSTQMAFIIVFALLPTLLFIILICSNIIPNFEEVFLSFIQLLLPKAGYDYITFEIDQLLSYLNRIEYFLIALSAIIGTVSSHTILSGINMSYGFRRYTSKKWAWIKSFILLIVLTVVLIIFTILFLYSVDITKEVIANANAGIDADNLSTTILYIFSILGGFVVLLGVYIFTPQRRISFKEAYPGAIFSIIGIVFLFRIYVYILNRTENYLIIYGSLSGLFILLTAFYFLCFIINMGAKINVFISYKTYKNRYGKIKKND